MSLLLDTLLDSGRLAECAAHDAAHAAARDFRVEAEWLLPMHGRREFTLPFTSKDEAIAWLKRRYLADHPDAEFEVTDLGGAAAAQRVGY